MLGGLYRILGVEFIGVRGPCARELLLEPCAFLLPRGARQRRAPPQGPFEFHLKGLGGALQLGQREDAGGGGGEGHAAVRSIKRVKLWWPQFRASNRVKCPSEQHGRLKPVPAVGARESVHKSVPGTARKRTVHASLNALTLPAVVPGGSPRSVCALPGHG